MNYFEHYKRVNNLSESGRQSHWGPFERTIGRFLPEAKDVGVIDVGCGAGILLEWLSVKGYKNCTGLDRDEGQVAFSRSLGFQAEQVDDTAAALSAYEDMQFIIFKDVLEHMPENEVSKVLEAARRALSPGGRIYVSVPNAAASFAPYWRYNDGTHLRSYTSAVLGLHLEMAGFRVIHVGDDDTLSFSSLMGIGRLLIRTLFRCVRRIEAIGEFGSDGVRMPLGLNLVVVAESDGE
ncbi:class I SAM-dependent methyltransferase [Litorivivens sp.]|uniref:class I SAM-dependent methyltransferase n=1 Tax=Litorivivens sp. TaxID=2020868 RepID=UPI003566DAFC